ncbi:hypothetical protein [Methylococcus geothermalis]|uniref:Uncharacterized protein n=1 Tax=Methylococcus geothermalis TaxID=2681310 RepID=A0A858Q5R0_9GAMM|nr:hypothetical protein [Methylococcus geothermalis]QJD29161.1 hypothetical protein GNH96_03715 [Methylococcus geothermalis]
MTYRKLLTSMTVAAGIAGNAVAGDVYPSYGIQYAAKLIFDKKDTKNGAAAASLHSGQTFNTPNDGGNATMIPQTKSMAWCDPAVTPAGYETNGCYGWGVNANWYLIDLSKLKSQGLTAVWVTINVERYQGAKPEENDIIPALTVYRGNQTLGPQKHWFPSELQGQPEFWGWLLQRDTFVKGDVFSYNSAYATPSQNLASVMGKFKLKGGTQDYLTVAVGGDAKDPNTKHTVNYQLTVDVKQKQPVQ